MKPTGLTRLLDRQGRMQVPKAVIVAAGFGHLDNYEMLPAGGDRIAIRKSQTGTHHIDPQGRMIVPLSLRKRAGMMPDDAAPWEGAQVEFFLDGESVVIRRYAPGCTICGNVFDSYHEIKGKKICLGCVSEILTAEGVRT